MVYKNEEVGTGVHVEGGKSCKMEEKEMVRGGGRDSK